MKKLITKIIIVLAISFSFSMTALAQDYPSSIDTGLHRWELLDKEKGYYSYKYNISGDHYDTKTGTYAEVMKELKDHEKEFEMAETQMTVLDNIFKQVGTDNNPSEEQLKSQVQIVQDEINKLPKGTKRDRLQGQLDSYKKQLADVIDNAKAFADAQQMYAKAIKADNLSDLSVYTSYMYTDEGFFGVKDIFPKIVNSLVSAIFFIPKLLYFITAKLITVLRSQDVLTQVSGVVTTSKGIYDKVLNIAYPYLIFFTIFSIARTFAKTANVARSLKKGLFYMLPFILGSVLYAPVIMNGQNTTVLGGSITTIKSVTDEFTSTIINNLSVGGTQFALDEKQNLTDNSVNAIKAKMFDEVIKKPFEALNFKTNAVKDNQDILNTELLATKGNSSKVKDFQKKYKDESDLEFMSIGSKFIVAFSALLKSSVLLIMILGMTLFSYAMNYFVIILLAFLIIVLIIALVPQLQHILLHFLITVGKFTAIGSFGLVGAQLLLYVNSLIEQATNSLNQGYFLTTLLQVVIWYLSYRNRHSIFGFLKKGKVGIGSVAKNLTPQFNKPSLNGKTTHKDEALTKSYQKKNKTGQPTAFTKRMAQRSKDGFYQAKDFAKAKGNRDKIALLRKERQVKQNLALKAKQEAEMKNKKQDGQPVPKRDKKQHQNLDFLPQKEKDLTLDKKIQTKQRPTPFDDFKDKTTDVEPKNHLKTKLSQPTPFDDFEDKTTNVESKNHLETKLSQPTPKKQLTTFSDNNLKPVNRKISNPIQELRARKNAERYPSGIEIPQKKR
ncbi:hypothetical protein FACS1894192_00760 [Bacilli bacterium]|nr:hypothetical protein FACS1894192_00760 [Bacilli bacterium]